MRLLLITLAFLASTAALADEPAAPPAAQKFFEVVATVRGSDGSVLVQNHYTPGGKVKLFAGKDACDVFVKNDPDFAASLMQLAQALEPLVKVDPNATLSIDCEEAPPADLGTSL